MPESVLIPPDNRLFALGMSDLTLYGGQPTTDIAFGRDATDGTSVDAAPAAAGAGNAAAVPIARSESETAAEETAALLGRTGDDMPVPSSAPPVAPVDLSGPAAADVASATPPPLGSGGTMSAPVATPLQVATGEQTPADTADMLSASLNSVTDAVAQLPGTVTSLAGTVTSDILTFGQAADVVPLAQSALVDPLGTVDTAVAELGVDGIGGPVAGDVGQLVGTAIDAMPLTAFGGSDPAAGFQTLIGMVESEEAFDLGPAVTPLLAEQTSGGSILDSLAADEAASPLLGGADDIAGHAVDDDGIHVGL